MDTTNLHPELAAVRKVWDRVRILVEEDEAHYSDEGFMLKLPNETVDARKERIESFKRGFVNFSGFLIRGKGDSVYHKEIQRTDLTTFQTEFEKRADRSGQTLEEILHNETAPALSAYGTVFAVIDKPAEKQENLELELKAGLPYLTMLSPFQVIDFEWGEDGELLWFQYSVDSFEKRAAPGKKAKKETQTVTWTREKYITKVGTRAAEEKENPFKFVPVVIQAQYVDPNKTIGKSSFFSTSNYIIMGNNLESAANNEVFKNAAATILMHQNDFNEDDVQRERNPESNLKRLKAQADDVKNVLLYVDGANKPEYLARDLDLIKLAADKGTSYFERAIENEKSALSVNTISMPQSGVAKGYDFIEVSNTLSSFAAAMERFERQSLRIVARIGGEDTSTFQVIYPKNFDTRSLKEKIEYIKGLIDCGYPAELGLKELYKSLTNEITQIEKTQQDIDKQIDAAKLPMPGDTKPEQIPNNQQPQPQGT
jgi:hypothetical protein